MEILETLKFVQGAISSKDHIPEMKHFSIGDGQARAYNGLLAISSPIEFAVNCNPKALPLIAAIDRCDAATALSMTSAGRLKIESGGFRAFVDCIEQEPFHLRPDGENIAIDGEAFLVAVKRLAPFVGKDASRPWVNGILLRGQSAFATNNVCLVEYWLGVELPFVVNIPIAAIKEVIRVKKPPSHIQLSDFSITFHYPDGCWIRSQLFETNWPDLSQILDRDSSPKELPKDLFSALEAIKPFMDGTGKVYFRDGDLICTHSEEGAGASYRVSGLAGEGIYNLSMLKLLEGAADTIDFSLHPQPLLFYGERLRGAIIGYRE